MSEENKAPAQPQATAPASGEVKPVELTVQDLGVLRSIIDVASQRGAFRGPELSQVGTVHDRLMKFLEANQPKSAEDGKPAATDDESKDGEVDKLD